MGFKDELVRRARDYAERSGLSLGAELGAGVHGIVFATESQPEEPPPVRSALKVHRHETDYRRERDVYFRLREHAVTTLRGFHVPRLLGHDDRLWVLEMTVVKRPFVLDFAGAYLDRPPDFPADVLADWEAEKRDQFGPRWPEVQAILGDLESYGVFVLDVNPGNISMQP